MMLYTDWFQFQGQNQPQLLKAQVRLNRLIQTSDFSFLNQYGKITEKTDKAHLQQFTVRQIRFQFQPYRIQKSFFASAWNSKNRRPLNFSGSCYISSSARLDKISDHKSALRQQLKRLKVELNTKSERNLKLQDFSP